MQKISKNQVKWVRGLQQKKNRDAESVFIAEGNKCIGELVNVFEPILIASCYPDECPFATHEATALEIEQMSSLRAPQGTIGVFRRPANTPLPNANESLLLALDGVQDPGNLGTIIRTADWFGVRRIICSHETAECWNPKVVQATMGALARVEVTYTDISDWLRQQDCPIYGTLLNGKDMYAPSAIPQKRYGVILMGNEGNGLTEEVRALVTHPLFIPPYPADAQTSESLNVSIATAVVLAEFRRK